MFDYDGDDGLIRLLIGLIVGAAVVCLIIYLIILVATVVFGIAAIGGTIYGGGSAVINYCSSFKENIIDSNKTSVMAA